MADERLLQLAGAAGLSIDWTDANGQPRRVSPEVLRTILAELGLPAETDQAIESSLATLGHGQQHPALPPLLTLDLHQRLALDGHFSPGQPYHLEAEESDFSHYGQLDEQAYLPAVSTPGYYRLNIGSRQLRLAVAPDACKPVQGRSGAAWGLTLQLYSLRRDGDGGLGDTGALEAVIRRAAARGADIIGISPVHAMFTAWPGQYSPYSPSSRLFLNILHSAPAQILGEDCYQQALIATGLAGELQRLEQLELIDWPAVTRIRQQLLRALFQSFCQSGHPLQADFASFRQQQGSALEYHCCFEALHAWLLDANGQAQAWQQWPAPYRHPDTPDVRAFTTSHAEEISYHAFCQWLMARGLQQAQLTAKQTGMTIGLVADLAVGADGGGSQAWSRQDELLSSLCVGAPPDILNQQGQNWGLSAFSPNGLRHSGFQAFIEMLRANLAHAGGLRIDHIMGLRRLWIMPKGADPTQGAYLNYPFDDLLRLLLLEAWRHDAVILGEDLGTVPPGLREQMASHTILGMQVLLFEAGPDGRLPPPAHWSPRALATTATHDIPTIAGWWQEQDIDWRIRVGQEPESGRAAALQQRAWARQGINASLCHELGLDENGLLAPEDAVDACAGFLGRTAAPLVLFPMEDTLGLTGQPNMPGLTEPHPNWRRRYPANTASQLDSPAAARRLALLAEGRRQRNDHECSA